MVVIVYSMAELMIGIRALETVVKTSMATPMSASQKFLITLESIENMHDFHTKIESDLPHFDRTFELWKGVRQFVVKEK